jgi:PhnB protein
LSGPKGFVRWRYARGDGNDAVACVFYPKPMKTPDSPSSASKTSVKPIPPDMHTVTPHLVCGGAAAAIEFYKKAFGATELARLATPDGKIMHASVKIGDSTVMLNDEFPDWGALGPKARNGTSVTLHVYVTDVDAAFDRAVKAGATVKLPVQDMFWGDRYGILVDPFGHNWSLATHVRDLTPDQVNQAMKEACP